VKGGILTKIKAPERGATKLSLLHCQSVRFVWTHLCKYPWRSHSVTSNLPALPKTRSAITENASSAFSTGSSHAACGLISATRMRNETIPPVVHIEISVPGHKDIVVAHEPDHLQRKYQAPDLRNAINEAFRIAERRLSKFKDKLTDHGVAERGHEAANEFRGQIAELTPEQDFGYVMTKEGGLLYFHRNSLLSGHFDDLCRGDAVSYVEQAGDTGPTASKVRVIGR
jgi:ribosome-associated translation inhibitor RaiA/cold shock CspA family protein